jgi:hypothetical protein
MEVAGDQLNILFGHVLIYCLSVQF